MDADPDDIFGLTAPDVVGLSEFAEMAGASPSAVSNWMTRHKDFPPGTRLTRGTIWSRPAVVAYLRAHGRLVLEVPTTQEG